MTTFISSSGMEPLVVFCVPFVWAADWILSTENQTTPSQTVMHSIRSSSVSLLSDFLMSITVVNFWRLHTLNSWMSYYFFTWNVFI